MTQVIVHAGYHKTGTTTLQEFMRANRQALKPHLDYYGANDFRQAGAHARIYAQRPFPHRLYRFRKAFRRFLRNVPPADVIVLSRETFSGGMPGHRRIGGGLMISYFGPSLKLARVIISELRRRFGRDVDITFFYTTREREAWLRSVHGHLLRSIKMTDDYDTFRARFPALLSPAEEAARMSGALSPTPVATAALEDYASHAHGPASALLDLAGVPNAVRATLVPASHANAGQPDELRETFRSLNAKNLPKVALKDAKAKLLKGTTR